ncbi:MAG: hypothetical protein M1157_02180 [Deinococcus sp.]|nr:hypothetical protein [Deinococcus sp.]
METFRKIVDALSDLVSPTAAERLLDRVLRNANLNAPDMVASDWVRLVEGPLLKELGDILPIGRPPRLMALVQALQLEAPHQFAQGAHHNSSETLLFESNYVDLSTPETRRQLIQDVARIQGVLGVMIDSGSAREARLPGLNPELAAMVASVHRSVLTKKGYRLFYTVVEKAQMVIRPLGQGWIGVAARKEANLGELIYRLRRMEPKASAPERQEV